jgi:glucokinase
MSSGLILAAEIGGTKLQAALGRADGTILARRRGSVAKGTDAEGILAWFPGAIDELRHESAQHGGIIEQIGVGFGGPIDTPSGRVLKSHQVGGWDDFPLRTWFERKTGLRTTIANDSNAAGWAEYRCGSGKGTRTFCYMNVGSGIGGALVVDGKLHDGQGIGAFEMGHTRIGELDEGHQLHIVKLEDRCSGWALEHQFRVRPLKLGTPLLDLAGGRPDHVTCAMIGEAATKGDELAIAAIDNLARKLGWAMANAITLVHPERFAVGGGVGLLGEVLLKPVRHHVNEYVFEPYRGRYEIVSAELGEDVVLVGALLLAGGG